MRLSTLLCFAATAATVLAESSREARRWLAKNKGKKGVVTTPSGLQYRKLKGGKGIHHPTAAAQCEVHYTGETHEGVMFDSSYSRGKPSTFAPNSVIKGWEEALQLMVEGDKWELFIPSEMAYGDEGGGGGRIKPGDALKFTVELLSIDGEKVLTAAEKERQEEVEKVAELARLQSRPPCSPFGRSNCMEKDRLFLDLVEDKGLAVITRRLRELESTAAKDQTDAEWRRRRVHILKTLKSALSPGDYTVTSLVTVREDRDGLGKVVGEIPAGEKVAVLEVRRYDARSRLRARVESPVAGWISILDTSSGRRWAEPAPEQDEL
eukprot:TRINITY_DN9142_c0_g3_i1.p2 TRINITY_DN9142_c0_g3~~TRINITY_DN9142_c0_g3_i1.p2  ORF type:complete len:322 (+),score=122.98 TRINITY_DN9142_c0_g3_i1:46-1011(+)